MTTNSLIRWIQTSLVAYFGIYMAVVVLGNLTDYGSNFLFVQHVLSMDTTFEDNNLRWRAIHSPWIHHIAYGSIIMWESIIAGLCLAGTIRMVKAIRDSAQVFHSAKNLSLAGLLAGITLWFLGFQVIGGEWFAMWQSEIWNGLDAAFRLTVYNAIALLALMHRQ